jgi:hypothetical protein
VRRYLINLGASGSLLAAGAGGYATFHHIWYSDAACQVIANEILSQHEHTVRRQADIDAVLKADPDK